MKKFIVGFAVLATHILIPMAIADGIKPPPYPPQHWYLSVDFGFSPEVVSQFVGTKPKDDFSFMLPSLHLMVFKDGSIHGNSDHPVLTRQINDDNGWAVRNQCIGFIPSNDLSRIHYSAFQVFNLFQFVEQYAPPDTEPEGINIFFNLTINDRSMLVKYDNLKTGNALPSGVEAVLTLLRRSLPPSYRKLFDYLNVATLPPLPESQAGLYKKCEMHDEWMKVADIPISYGLPRFDENYMKAEKQLFPNANLRRLGGCVVSENSPRTTKGLYCESCRRAETEWREKQKERVPSR